MKRLIWLLILQMIMPAAHAVHRRARHSLVYKNQVLVERASDAPAGEAPAPQEPAAQEPATPAPVPVQAIIPVSSSQACSQTPTTTQVAALPDTPAAACVASLHNIAFGDLNDEAGCAETTRQYTEGNKAVACYRGGGCSLNGAIPDATHRSANPNSLGACVSSCGVNPARGVDLLLNNLYGTFFHRAPEDGGLAFWRKAYNSNPNFNCVNLVSNIVGSVEFNANTSNLIDADFVNALYAGLFRRTPDIGGLAANLNALSQLSQAMGKDAGRAALVNAFVGSAEMLMQCHSDGLWQVNEP